MIIVKSERTLGREMENVEWNDNQVLKSPLTKFESHDDLGATGNNDKLNKTNILVSFY